MEDIIVASIAPWNTLLPTLFNNTGNNSIKAAPIKAPLIVPNPPRITINKILKDSLISNATGSNDFKYVKAKSAPATPQ